jgi:hypothetical protein
MPSKPHDPHYPEQEHSIKQRSLELFVKGSAEHGANSAKPFSVHLRETPAQPLSPTTRALFWIVGVLVGLLFLAAVWRILHRHHAPRRPPAASSRASGMETEMGRLSMGDSLPT